MIQILARSPLNDLLGVSAGSKGHTLTFQDTSFYTMTQQGRIQVLATVLNEFQEAEHFPMVCYFCQGLGNVLKYLGLVAKAFIGRLSRYFRKQADKTAKNG